MKASGRARLQRVQGERSGTAAGQGRGEGIQDGPLCFATRTAAADCTPLERLCRQVMRPPLATGPVGGWQLACPGERSSTSERRWPVNGALLN